MGFAAAALAGISLDRCDMQILHHACTAWKYCHAFFTHYWSTEYLVSHTDWSNILYAAKKKSGRECCISIAE